MTAQNSAIKDVEGHVDALLDEMTLEEQVALLAGADSWTIVPVECLGITVINVMGGTFAQGQETSWLVSAFCQHHLPVTVVPQLTKGWTIEVKMGNTV